MPQIAVGGTVVPIQNPVNGPGINGVNVGDNPIYVGPDPTVNAQSASQTLQNGDVLNWPANESLYIVCDHDKVSIFQYSNNGATITKGTLNTNIISGTVDIGGDVTLSGPVELAAGSEVAIAGDVNVNPVTISGGSVGITGTVNIDTTAPIDATITNAQIDVAGSVDVNHINYSTDNLSGAFSPIAITTDSTKIYDSGALVLSKYQTLNAIIGTSTAAPCVFTFVWSNPSGSGAFIENYYSLMGINHMIEAKGSTLKIYAQLLGAVTGVMGGVNTATINQLVVSGIGVAIPPYCSYIVTGNNPGPNSMTIPLYSATVSPMGFPAIGGSRGTATSFRWTTASNANVRFYLPSVAGNCTSYVVNASTGTAKFHYGITDLYYGNLGIGNEHNMYVLPEQSLGQTSDKNTAFYLPQSAMFMDILATGSVDLFVNLLFQPDR